MIKLVLDAGHGPNTPGKRTPLFADGSFMHEYEFNSAVVRKLKKKLTATAKFNITVTSSDSEDIKLSDRVRLEKQIKADLFLSVHANAMSNVWGTPKGIESFYNSGSTKGRNYCTVIQDNLVKDTGLVNRGAKSAPGPSYPTSLYVLKNTYAPAVLVECGFMDNANEAVLLMSDSYREIVATSLFNSICDIFTIEVDKTDYKRLYEECKTKLDKIKEIL
ncbi:MAG: N-acetylmuramoyl-L-alanine amidase [Alteromonadales bacterium]|nr:N-acetylmuramoyl-L-alanine amidase [Alteromonadales bacterium]